MISNDEIFNSRILVVDDQEANIEMLQNMLTKAGYSSIIGVSDSRKVEGLYAAYNPDLVLLDINMPHLNGFEVMEKLREVDNDSYIPVLVLTGLQDKDVMIKALNAGAQDFLSKPLNRLEMLTRIRNMVTVRLLHKQVRDQNLILEKKVQERTIELQDTRLEIIRRLGMAAEYRDNETGEHIIRMSQMSSLLGKLTGMKGDESELLLNASPMHDIGKIGIPDSIMLKPGKLSSDEFNLMKTHTTIGGDLLDGHDSELMVSARLIALTHHEKWDGSGYPKGLKGEEIPLEGRITGIVDVFDALSSKRPYKGPYPVDKVCELIKRERGKHFDPSLVDLFLDNVDDFITIRKKYTKEENLTPPENFKLSERDMP